MIALVLAACTSLPTASDVGGAAPPDWIRVASAPGRWRGSFPDWPIVSEQPQTVRFGDEPAQDVVIRWTQASPSWGTYAIGTVPQTPAVLASTGPKMIALGAARGAAERLQGRLDSTVEWEGIEGGIRGQVTGVDDRYSSVAAAVVDGVLVLAHATSHERGSVEGFLDGIQVYGEKPAPDVAVGEGIRARCPAFCGPGADTVSIAGVATELTGFRGVLDGDRFEIVVAPLRAGVDPLAAQEDLRARFVHRVNGQLTDVHPEALDGHDGVRARYLTGLAVGDVRTGIVGDEVVAAEVWAGSGGLPAWSDAFLGSVTAR